MGILPTCGSCLNTHIYNGSQCWPCHEYQSTCNINLHTPISPGDFVDQRIIQFDWLRAFYANLTKRILADMKFAQQINYL